MRLRIYTKDDPVVRTTAKPVSRDYILSPVCAKLRRNMIETMHAANGIGLAAPQIGESIRIVVIAFKDGALFMANPEILKPSLLKITEEEGCLSVPGVFGKVRRHKRLRVRFLDEHAQTQSMDASGLFARVVQHEVDHLNAVLYIDRATVFTQGHP